YGPVLTLNARFVCEVRRAKLPFFILRTTNTGGPKQCDLSWPSVYPPAAWRKRSRDERPPDGPGASGRWSVLAGRPGGGPGGVGGLRGACLGLRGCAVCALLPCPTRWQV